MSLKDEFFEISTYLEFVEKRKKFQDLDFQYEKVQQHFRSLTRGHSERTDEEGVMTELYKNPITRKFE